MDLHAHHTTTDSGSDTACESFAKAPSCGETHHHQDAAIHGTRSVRGTRPIIRFNLEGCSINGEENLALELCDAHY